VVRSGTRPSVAVVQRSKERLWALPRGKLRWNERPVCGARREVVEETGFRVNVSEFLGAITYLAGGRPMVVQFWLMQAAARPSYGVTKDILTVELLSLAATVKRLSHTLERLFLANVGRYAVLQHKRRKGRKAKSAVSKVERAFDPSNRVS